jgi:hypothetical protein
MSARPSRYPSRRQDPAPADASLAMRYQMPSNPAHPADISAHSPDPAPAADAKPEAPEGRPGDERTRLLERITGARTPHRALIALIVECEGIAAFSDSALRRMGAILDILENTQEKTE